MSDIRFRPVRGKESIIKDQAIVDGNIYFATDSGKIFIDAQGERSLMGGSGTSVLYTEATNIIEKTDGTYVIPTSTLVDQGYMPRRDDLIINTDGRFFKVFQANSNSIVAYLLAVSGNGTGGNTPGGPSGDDQGITVQWHDVKKSFIAGRPYNIEFTATSPTDKYITVEYRVETPTAVVETKTIEVISGERTSVEVGSKMSTSGYNAVYFTFIGMNAGSITATINRIKAIEFKIEQDNENFNNYRIYNSTFNYYVNIKGSVSKELHVTVDDKTLAPVTITGEKTGYPITINCGNLGLTAGRHAITAYLVTDGLPSNAITTEFIYHPEGSADATYIIVADYPQTCYTYETPSIKYWVYNTAQPANTINKIDCYINGELDKTVYEAQFEGSGAELRWNVGMLPAGINSLTLTCNGINNIIQINTIQSDIFDAVTDSAILLLDAVGRSNSTSLEKRLDWSYGNTKAILNDFNWYNNGWCTDTDGRSCLRISNGASVEIPLKLFTNTQPSTGGYTVEFEFKPYNLYSYDLLSASTEIEGEDEKVTIKRTYDPTKAIIKYLQGSGTSAYGFCCGTQDAYCRLSDGTSVTARYCDDEIITVAISINAAKEQMFIYLNGVMSGMIGYVRAAGEMPTLADKLYITSEYCDIDLYNIKVYSGKALTSAEIVQNYISNKKDLAIYNQNKLSTGTSINLNDIIEYNTNNPDNATIPYAIITTKAPDILPYVKVEDDKDAVIVDIEFVNPSLDYKFNMGSLEGGEDAYLHQAPSFKATNVIFNVQGTSSQTYPRKNFKAKFKNSTITYTNEKISEENKISSNHKLYLDSEIGEKAFTWKADYMDSSGCHNTGFTSYVNLLYSNHPLDYYENTSGKYKDIYRTTIYGFPMLVFHKKSNGTIEFIGKYNFNHDKGCDDTLGFTHEGKNKILDKSYEEVAECWEFGNNKPGRCSFRGDAFDTGYNYTTETGKLNLSDDLEVRYHKNADAIENAFKNLAEDGVSIISDKEAFDILLGGDENTHPNGYGNLEKVFLWLQEVDFVSEADADQKTIKRNRFINEFTKHFNMDYCLVYYIMTDLLIQYDSSGKNMMLASWGPLEEGGEYIWFPIFYDVDTQLGVNNSGVPLWDYNEEPSNNGTFSTANSILWTCFNDAFMTQIQNRYRELRQGNLTIEKLLGYNNFDYNVSHSEAMNGILPINIINADEYYKYIDPAITGYIPPEGGGLKKESGYYYCLQGTRELHREQFLRNRFNYYDSMWLAGLYNTKITTGTFIRINAYDNTIDDALDSTTTFTVTPRLDQYVVLWPDEIEPSTALSEGRVTPIRVDGGTAQEFNIIDALGEGDYQQQIVYIGGKDYIQDYGDLSLLYLDEMDFQTTSLRSVVVGNENSNYSNEKAEESFVQRLRTADINDGGKPLLQTYDITNLSQVDGTISLTTANKLTTFKALGTNITNALFANGVALNQLYLPETINKLELIEAYNLDKIYYDYSDILDNGKQSKAGLYIANVIHHDDIEDVDTTRINSIKLVGGALDLYSYDLLNKLTAAKVATRGKTIEGHTDKLAIHCEDVHWTPYTQLGSGANYDSANTYYYAQTNCTYSTYNYNNLDQWNKDLAAGKIYTYDETLVALLPTNLSMLDAYIDNNEMIYFTNIYTEEKDKGMPVISGELFVNGMMSEYDIAHKYNRAFPDLVIRAKEVNEAYRACYIAETNGIENILTIDRYASASDTISPPDTSKLSIPQHHDFVGWKVKGGDDTIYKTASDFASLSFETNEIVFILQVVPHAYNFKFKDGDGTEYSVPVVYNTLATLPDIIPHKPEDVNLGLREVYAFKGWTNDSNYYGVVASESVATSMAVNVTAIKATQDQTFYAMFVEDSVYNNVLDSSYFTVTVETSYTDTNNSLYSVTGPCASIRFKTSEAELLRGKITIPLSVPHPSQSNTMLPVCWVGGFQGAANVTHCFFDTSISNELRVLQEDCFRDCSAMRFIELPDSLRVISKNAFFSCTRLAMTEYAPYDIIIGPNVYTIGETAFCLGGDSITHTWTTNIYIGASTSTIVTQAFAYIDRAVNNIAIGALNKPTALASLGTDAFKLNGGYGPYNNITIYCYDNAHHLELENRLASLYSADPIVVKEFTYVWGEGALDNDNVTDTPGVD